MCCVNLDNDAKYANRWWSAANSDAGVQVDQSALLTRSYNSIQRMKQCGNVSCSGRSVALPLLVQGSPCLDLLASVQTEYRHDKRALPSKLAGDYTSACQKTQSARGARKPVDMSLFLGRSFRAGFDQFGRFVHPSTNSVVHVRKLMPVQSSSSGTGSDPAHARVLQVLLDASSVSVSAPVVQGDGELSERYCHSPLWSLPQVNLNGVRSGDPEAVVEYAKLAELLKRLADAFEPAGGGALSPSDPKYAIYQCVKLIDAALGQEHVGGARAGRRAELIPLLESGSLYYDDQSQESSCSAGWERRVGMVTEWLEAVTRQELGTSSRLPGGSDAGQNDATFDALFEFLTCRRVHEAIELAESAGLWHLAMLLSQLGGDVDFAQGIAAQVDKWIAACPADITSDGSGVIPPKLLDVYKVLGGMLIHGDDTTGAVHSVVQGVSWTRSVGMFYWYTMGYHAKMSTALRCYENALGLADPRDGSLVKFPAAAVSLRPGAARSSHKHVLYHLLLVLFPSSVIDDRMVAEGELVEDEATLALVSNIIEALKPRGHTADVLDYRGSFLVLSLLICFDIFSYDCVAACIVRQHMLAQLLAEKEWKWALFVACQAQNHVERTSLVKSILQQWVCISSSQVVAGEVEKELEELFSLDEEGSGMQVDQAGGSSAELFAVRQLQIPKEWVCEAVAVRHYQRSVSLRGVAADSLSAGDHVLKAVRFHILGHHFIAAAELIAEEIAAGWIMSGDAAAPAPGEAGDDTVGSNSGRSRLVTLLETIEEGLLQQEEELRGGQDPGSSCALEAFHASSSGMLLEYYRIKDLNMELQAEAQQLVAAAAATAAGGEGLSATGDLQARAEDLEDSWHELGLLAHGLLKKLPGLRLCSRFAVSECSDSAVLNVAIQYDIGTMLYGIIQDLNSKLVSRQVSEVAESEMKFVLKQ